MSNHLCKFAQIVLRPCTAYLHPATFGHHVQVGSEYVQLRQLEALRQHTASMDYRLVAEFAAVADAGAPTDADTFGKCAVRADGYICGEGAVRAYAGVLAEGAARAESGVLTDSHVGCQGAVGTYAGAGGDGAARAEFDVTGDGGAGMDDGLIAQASSAGDACRWVRPTAPAGIRVNVPVLGIGWPREYLKCAGGRNHRLNFAL